MKTAVIILGHGSRSAGADEAIRKVVNSLKQAGSFAVVEHAFLQYVPPALHETLANCAGQKVGRIVIVPFFLQAGAHVTRDIPELIAEAREAHPGVEIIVTDYIGAHPLMSMIVEKMVKQKV